MMIGDRRSGIDTRTEAAKQLAGERRSGVERRTGGEPASIAPSKEQLALFARRLRRTMRDNNGRSHLGTANAEHDFAFFPEIVRVVEWIERLSAEEAALQPRPTLRKAVVGAARLPAAETVSLQPGVATSEEL
jgi:hypothetical protein